MIKRAIIDVSSVIWTCLLAGKDKEFGREVIGEDGKKYQINSAVYGYENTIEHLKHAMSDLDLQPWQMIFVPEGKNSKADRQFIHEGYKAGRDKAPEQYEQFHKCREMVLDVFMKLGSQQAWQDGIEADDVIGYLALNLDGIRYIVSGDKDLAQLVGENPNIHQWRAGEIDANPFGGFPHKFIPVYIALVGDTGDKIPGAKGFGDGAWLKMLDKFGLDGLELMEQLIKDRQLLKLEEDVGELKELQKIIDDADGVYMSYDLGRLRIEKVNSMRRPLNWKAGMVRSRALIDDERLQKYGGVVRIVSKENYAEAFKWLKHEIGRSPFVSLDIETSTPDESDAWLEALGKEEKAVDVYGSELTSLQLTFGQNLQYTVYLPFDNVDAPDCHNLTMDQIMGVVDCIPRDKITYIQNVSFELPICYMSWGDKWADDPEYHGFLRNVRDTKIMSSYVDENRPSDLKENSRDRLGYNQMTYAEVTTKDYVKSEWHGVGKVLQTYKEPVLEKRMVDDVEEFTDPETGEVSQRVTGQHEEDVHVGDIEHVVVQHKMNQLTARQVVDYGADDAICTIALANHFRCIMEIERTWETFEEVETFPAYLTALAFVQGTEFSRQEMAAIEKEDDAVYDKAWPKLRDYLMKIGFEGTICPKMLDEREALAYLEDNNLDSLPDHMLEYSAKGIKAAFQHVTGAELKTQVRTPDKLAKLIEQAADEMDDEDAAMRARIFADAVAKRHLDGINEMIARNFNGEPQIDLASPRHMSRLLYDRMGLPVRVINDVTPLERKSDPKLDAAIKKFKQIRAGKGGLSLDGDDLVFVRKKASGNDTAIELAMAFDKDKLADDAREALQAILDLKKVMTRRSLFYSTYWKVPHWKDAKIHSNANQCAAVTRRYSMSLPNLQQLPKKGEGVKFRGCFKPHHKRAVICSIDYAGQELRLAAERSQDRNMLACYVGEHLKDIHSITASGAVKLKWEKDFVDHLFATHGADLARDEEGSYELFVRVRNLGKAAPEGKKADDLRKDSKNVNFGAQNGAKAVKLAETLIMSVEDAQLFLDARAAMFPGVDKAAERAAEEAMRTGYALTMMGARRHLREAMMSNERGAAERAARQAWNFEIQGSAGEMTKLGMSRLWKSGVFFKYDARFIAPIHDELVSSVAEEHAVDFIREKHAAMTGPYADMQVPIVGSISVGPDFAHQTECGEAFNPAVISKALNAIFQLKEAA